MCKIEKRILRETGGIPRVKSAVRIEASKYFFGIIFLMATSLCYGVRDIFHVSFCTLHYFYANPYASEVPAEAVGASLVLGNHYSHHRFGGWPCGRGDLIVSRLLS